MNYRVEKGRDAMLITKYIDRVLDRVNNQMASSDVYLAYEELKELERLGEIALQIKKQWKNSSIGAYDGEDVIQNFKNWLDTIDLPNEKENS